MKRQDILAKLGYTVPAAKTKRVIILSDLKNEADDQFAVMHHLLTPSLDVKGIVACHFEYMARFIETLQKNGQLETMAKRMNVSLGETDHSSLVTPRGGSMQRSYNEGQLLLRLAQIDDVPLLKGSCYELPQEGELPESEGADFIIAEAMKDDPAPLYVCMLGCVTDLAIAYLKQPEIASRLTAVWIGGGPYPMGEQEFNLMQDVPAANLLFASPMPFWQIPCNVYRTVEIAFSELITEIKPQGEIGNYLCEQMLALHTKMGGVPGDFPNAETWVLGDNPTVSVLLQNPGRGGWHTEKPCRVNDDYSYTQLESGREIRVYDSVDARLTLHDLFSKLKLCYHS